MLEMTPENGDRYGEIAMITVSKMLLALPGRETGDLAAEAKGEAYMAALEDLPCWAVQEAMRRWYRAECGDKYDYRWAPGPAALREIAVLETFRVKGLQRQLEDLLNAVPALEFSEDHCSSMKERLTDLGLGIEKQEDQSRTT